MDEATKREATPRPWRVDTTPETPSIIADPSLLPDDDDGNVICFAPEGLSDSMAHWSANAELIVRAVNQFREWETIESAPRDGRTLLFCYKNPLGKWRTTRGQWFTNDEISEWENGDEFCAGWYETSVENDEPPNCWPITPSHWMPLPPAPQPEDSEKP